MKNAALLSTPLILLMATQLTACGDESSDDTGDPGDLTGTTEQTLSVGGDERTYLLTIPESYSGDEPVPVLFNLHALQSNAQQQLTISGFEELAAREGFILVTPGAVGGVWTVTGFPIDNGSDDLGFIDALADELTASYAIDPDRMYATGMSQGGFLAFDLVCNDGPDFAAIAPVSGVMTPDMTEACAPARRLPVLQTHGTADDQIDYEASQAAVQWWVAFNGASATPEVTALSDDFPDNGTTVDRIVFAGDEAGVDVEHLRINGGGHVWPGASGDSDVDIAEEIWSFLSSYDLDGRIGE